MTPAKTALFATLILTLSPRVSQGMDTFGSLSAGYKSGLSLRGTMGLSGFAQGFPLSIEFGISYTSVDAGDPFPARRIFIADATNGTPEKYGTTWDLRLDFLYNLNLKGPKAIYVFAGPRFAMFDAHFHYVGANEEFDVTSNPWGIGLGMKGLFAISNRGRSDSLGRGRQLFRCAVARTRHDVQPRQSERQSPRKLHVQRCQGGRECSAVPGRADDRTDIYILICVPPGCRGRSGATLWFVQSFPVCPRQSRQTPGIDTPSLAGSKASPRMCYPGGNGLPGIGLQWRTAFRQSPVLSVYHLSILTGEVVRVF